MTRNSHTSSKSRRVAAVIAVLALAGVLGGCVVYPAGYGYGRGYGYGYGYGFGYHHFDRDWH